MSVDTLNADLATLREFVGTHDDPYDGDTSGVFALRRVEAELSRLREQRDEARNLHDDAVMDRAAFLIRAEAAEAEASRLREERDAGDIIIGRIARDLGGLLHGETLRDRVRRAAAAEARCALLATRNADLCALVDGIRHSGDEYVREKFEALTTAWREAEARCAAMEECDCIPAPFSSKACPKCGRRGVVTETTVHSLMVEIRDEKARCARLQQALDHYGNEDHWEDVSPPVSVNTAGYLVFEYAGGEELPWKIAREALAGPDTPADSQPEEACDA